MSGLDRRLLSVAVLACAFAGCSRQAADNSPASPREVPGYGSSSPASTPSVDPCTLPVSQRTGGWFCYGSASPTP